MKIIYKTLSIILIVSLLAACNLPSWLTYTNTTYQFQLQYPSTGALETDTPLAARIRLPGQSGTNLVESYLDIAVSEGAIPCLSPYSAAYTPPGSLVTGEQTINGNYWVIERAAEGAAGSIFEWTAYSTSNGSTCVSLTFVMHSHHPDAYPTHVPVYDPTAESILFTSIVNTFTWLTGTHTPISYSSSTTALTPTPAHFIGVTIQVGGAGPTGTPTHVSYGGLSNTLTPTPVPLFFTTKINAHCRLGPGLIFDSLDVAMSGQAYLMDGRNLEDTWFRIMLTASRGCWVEASTGVASGDTMKLRVLISPPTPTLTKVVVCSNFTVQKTCEAQPICRWRPPALSAVGDCVNK